MMNDATGFGSKEAGELGGTARAKSLSSERRSEIAQQAALRRWGKEVVQATHDGTLTVFERLVIPCAVLSDGTRVITQYGFLKAIGRSGRPAAGRGSSFERRAPFLDSDNLKPFVDDELEAASKPITFRMASGGMAHGYRAELLPRVCEVYLRARDKGALRSDQAKFAAACELVMRGLAHVGIIALVDEATGFQDDRDRNALAKILEAFIDKELRAWVKTFPVEYYKELYRLRGLQYPPQRRNMPRYFGTLTNDIVYSRLAPAVLDELKRRNPANEKGNRAARHHQWLTQDVGHPKLLQHLGGVVTVMKLSQTWEDFKVTLDKTHPKHVHSPLFESTGGDPSGASLS